MEYVDRLFDMIEELEVYKKHVQSKKAASLPATPVQPKQPPPVPAPGPALPPQPAPEPQQDPDGIPKVKAPPPTYQRPVLEPSAKAAAVPPNPAPATQSKAVPSKARPASPPQPPQPQQPYPDNFLTPDPNAANVAQTDGNWPPPRQECRAATAPPVKSPPAYPPHTRYQATSSGRRERSRDHPRRDNWDQQLHQARMDRNADWERRYTDGLHKDRDRPRRCHDTTKLVWTNPTNSSVRCQYQRPPYSGTDYSMWSGKPEFSYHEFPHRDERVQSHKEDRQDPTPAKGRSFVVSGWHSELNPQDIWTIFVKFFMANRIPFVCMRPELVRGEIRFTITFSNPDYTEFAKTLFSNWVSMPRMAADHVSLRIDLPEGAIQARRATSKRPTTDQQREDRARPRHS